MGERAGGGGGEGEERKREAKKRLFGEAKKRVARKENGDGSCRAMPSLLHVRNTQIQYFHLRKLLQKNHFKGGQSEMKM